MLFPIIVTALVGIAVLLVINFAKKVNAEATTNELNVAEPTTPSIHEEIAKTVEAIKAQAPIVEAPTTTAKPKAKKKPANKKKTIKVDA